ncbi:uncharacterized protein J8A68_001989 [[Candida] subhashii]|uniref:L-2-hydroxyglutarate dehydrogenase, mitochondrial n=1 Tax=[Candida] subhashii TaxID=561895 RepID=A0A8J5QLT5_9ASCO|nr:uncharacterized protein J8A68_001989 [[Candida] subhashii]KAG7664483.1 hypothetical protein J8A68_001989 [[Candida] subhashii]
MFTQVKKRFFHQSRPILADFSHVVIGGGVVGTAVAAELQLQPGSNVLLLEQHGALGSETTSRNSEVIHAGIYYPKDTLKAQLCIKGKQRIYEAFEKGHFQSVQKCGKWVVAQNREEEEYLFAIFNNARDLNVPVTLLPRNLAMKKHPLIHVGQNVLVSPTTGILNVHDYVLFHEGRFENAEGTISLNSKVTALERENNEYKITVQDTESQETTTITSENLINSAGLHAAKISNMLLPPSLHYEYHFAKGNYYSFTPETPVGKISDVLIYPCPNPNATSLGTHLTFDLGGQIRFGPDIEWLDTEDPEQIDYTPNALNLPKAYEAIRSYYPSLPDGSLNPSYSGVRPKTVSKAINEGISVDFRIKQEEGYPGFVNLMGIESPGLTAAWGIAEYVRDMYYK